MSDILSRILSGVVGGGQGGGMQAGGMQGGGGLGGLLGGLLGGGGGGSQMGGLASGLGGVKGMALMALLAYMTGGQGGARGLSSLTEQLRGAGLGPKVDSWVGSGGNEPMDPEELARAIPPDALAEVESHTGMGRNEILSQLSRGLPQMVDRLTPQGRLPERDEDLPDEDPDTLLGGFGFGRDPRG